MSRDAVTPEDGGSVVAGRILAAARAAGCREAELFIKTSSARTLALEPPLHPDLPTHVSVSRQEEAGAGLRVTDAEGRTGLAWRGGGIGLREMADVAFVDAWIREALVAAWFGRAASGRGTPGMSGASRSATDAPATGSSATDAPATDSLATDGAEEAAAIEASHLDLIDPECLERPDAHLAALAEAAVAEIARLDDGTVEIDRVVVTEARTTVCLSRLSGFERSYARTIAALSISLVPAAAGAEAVIEERSACRMEDLDPASTARDAVHRALPRRTPAEPRAPGGSASTGAAGAGAAGAGPARGSPPKTRLILEPRAAATLLAALGPWITAGALSAPRPSALSIVDDPLARGRPGSAPFDGEGRAARKRVLFDRGRAIEPITPETGPWQRLSYRDLPAAAPVALAIVPGRRREPGRREKAASQKPASGETASEKPASGEQAAGDLPAPPTIRAAAIEIRPGPLWSLIVRRGDWLTGEGRRAPGEPADGWSWEGPALALVQAVVETGDDLRWYQVGIEVGAPTVVLDGLAPWIEPTRGES